MASPIIREAFEIVTKSSNALKHTPLRTSTKNGALIKVFDISQEGVLKLRKEVLQLRKDGFHGVTSHIDKNGKATVELIETPAAKIESLANGIKIWLHKQKILLLGEGNIKTAGNLMVDNGKSSSYYLTQEASQKILNAAKKSAEEVNKVIKELALV